MTYASPGALNFQRATFLVADLERAIAFYRDVLGFRLAFIKESDANAYAYDVFAIARDTPIRLATLSTTSQQRTLGLIEVKGLATAQETPRRAAIVLGAGEGFDALLDRAKAAGAPLYDEHVLKGVDGREGREAALLDPDGNLIVLFTFDEKPSSIHYLP
jgi:catechol 2,3-dioxygenase-like lactoylglutathione lyase family enzyme